MEGWVLRRGTVDRPIPDEATLGKWATEKRIKSSDLIYHPTLQRWLYARDVEEIRAAFQLPVPSSPTAPLAPNSFWAWGSGSRSLGILGGLVSIAGGIALLLLKAAGENSLIEAIAHGIGIYCVGKGIFMVAIVINAKAALDHISHGAGRYRQSEHVASPSALQQSTDGRPS